MGDWQELKDRDESEVRLSDYYWGDLKRSMRAYLFSRGDKWDFFHQQLKQAVGNRYLDDKEKRHRAHKTITDYLELMGYQHLTSVKDLPHHLIKSGENGGAESDEWNRLEKVLCDLCFIEAKCSRQLVYELIGDYAATLDALPEAQEEKEKELKHEKRVNKYTRDLIAYARGEIDELEIIPSVKPWSDEESRKDTERIIRNSTHLDMIRAFSQFVSAESHRLVQYEYVHSFCLQQACNYADSGPVVCAAEALINAEMDSVMLLQLPSQRLKFNPRSNLRKTIDVDLAVSVAMTPDGKIAVSGSSDGTIRVWLVETGERLWTLKGHTWVIRSVSITPDGKTAVSGSYDETIRVWDAENGICLRVLKENTGRVRYVSITSDGKKVISASEDKVLRVWDIDTGECLGQIDGYCNVIGDMSVTPDGKTVVFVDPDRTLQVWDIDALKPVKSLIRLTSHQSGVCITPDGNIAVVAGFDIFKEEIEFMMWDLKNEECLGKFVSRDMLPCTAVNISHDGKRAVTIHDDNIIRVWNLPTGECIKWLDRHRNEIKSLSLTPDGRKMISASEDDTLLVWDVEKGKSSYVFEGKSWDYQHGCSILSVTPNGKEVLSGSSDGTIRMYDWKTGDYIRTLHEYVCQIATLKMTPCGKRAIYGCGDGTVRVWDLQTESCLKIFKKHRKAVNSLCVSPDGRVAVSGSYDNTIRVWNLESMQSIKKFEGRSDSVNGIVTSSDGKKVVSGNRDNTIRVWDLGTMEKGVKTLRGHSNKILSFNMAPDGKLVVSGSCDNTIRTWDLGDIARTRKRTIKEDGKITGLTLTLTPDGKQAIVFFTSEGDYTSPFRTGGNLSVLNLRTGNRRGLSIDAHKYSVGGISVTPDGKRIISASPDTIQIHCIQSCKCVAVYPVHSTMFGLQAIVSGLVYGTHSGKIVILSWNNPPNDPPVINSVRIWHYLENDNLGKWDDNITGVCLWCGKRFPVEDKILDVITAITGEARLPPEQSPCLELPEEAWEEPGLLSECPYCHKPLKFNPFVVDEMDS